RHLRALHRLEHAQGAARVVVVVRQRLRHGLAHVGEGGEVHDALDAVRGERLRQRLGVTHVELDEGDVRGHGLPVTAAQVVEGDGGVTAAKQRAERVGPDVTSSAGDQYLHGGSPTANRPATGQGNASAASERGKPGEEGERTARGPPESGRARGSAQRPLEVARSASTGSTTRPESALTARPASADNQPRINDNATTTPPAHRAPVAPNTKNTGSTKAAPPTSKDHPTTQSDQPIPIRSGDPISFSVVFASVTSNLDPSIGRAHV